MSIENAARPLARPRREPNHLVSIDLNRVRMGAAFIATAADGTKYRVTRDPNPTRKNPEDPAMAYVLVTELVTMDGSDEIVFDEAPMYAHSILATGNRWFLENAHPTGMTVFGDYTDTITTIMPVAGS